MFFEIIFAKPVLVSTSQGVSNLYIFFHEHLSLQFLEGTFIE